MPNNSAKLCTNWTTNKSTFLYSFSTAFNFAFRNSICSTINLPNCTAIRSPIRPAKFDSNHCSYRPTIKTTIFYSLWSANYIAVWSTNKATFK